MKNDLLAFARHAHHENFRLLGLVFVILFFLSSCSVTKNLPPNEKLYTGAKVKIDDQDTPAKKKKVLETELEGSVRPKPNTSFLGIRYKLMFYNLIREVKRKKRIGYFIKHKLGEPPVLFSSVSV